MNTASRWSSPGAAISGIERVEPFVTSRNRILYSVLVLLVVAMGLASRRYAAALPSFVAEYAGDTLWALMVFIGIGFLAPRWPSLRVAFAALAVAYVVEVSQLYHAPWIDVVRDTTAGRLVLGEGFLWSDFACYTAGVALGVALEMSLTRRASVASP